MKKLNEMTIEEKIGQLFCIGFDGYELNENVKFLIEKYKIANIILFTRNIKDIHQLFILCQEIHSFVLEHTGTIPLISIDQEGGMVTRIMSGGTFFPGAMTVSATQNPSYAYNVGKLMAIELRALGINMNLAPSLDINNNPINPVIGVRSYGDTPEEVTKYGSEFIRGLQENGVIATAKHFPGHGDSNGDSHKMLPTIAHSKERLRKIELVPFINNINKVDAIMSGHVFFPAYAQENTPGTLSKSVVTDLLRKELGYKGLIISDCMEMKAIDDTFTTEKGCVMGLVAGLDQAMVSHTYEKQLESIKEVYKAYEDGILTLSMINEKVSRTLALKEKSYKVLDKYFFGKDYFEVKGIIDNLEHKAFAQKVVDESLTLVKGENINYDYLMNNETLVITTEPFATTIAEDELSTRSIGSAIYENKLEIKIRKIKVSITDEEIDEIVNESKKYKQVLVCTYNANMYTNQAKLINKLNQKCKHLYVLSTRSPYDLNKFKQIKNYLCLYEYTPNSCNTIVKYLKNELTPVGKLPIKLSQNIRCGASVYCGLVDYTLEDNLKYLELLKEKNIDIVFMSGHMPERSDNFEYELKLLLDKASELGLKVSLDVSKSVYDLYKDYNLYALRLDGGFTPNDILDIIKEDRVIVELNATTVSKKLLDFLKNNNVDFNKIRVTHNFYPKKHTGLSLEMLLEKNKMLHEYGLEVGMFIPSNTNHRPPFYDALPTLEMHRDMNYYNILSTIKSLNVEEVIIGDSYASIEELDLIKNYDYDLITLPVEISSNINIYEREIFNHVHTSRIDSPSCFTRSRVNLFGKENEITPHDTIERKKYSITIDNTLFLRYKGEVNVLKSDLESDNRCNVIGRIKANDYILSLLTPGAKFKFVIIGEYD